MRALGSRPCVSSSQCCLQTTENCEQSSITFTLIMKRKGSFKINFNKKFNGFSKGL